LLGPESDQLLVQLVIAFFRFSSFRCILVVTFALGERYVMSVVWSISTDVDSADSLYFSDLILYLLNVDLELFQAVASRQDEVSFGR
jgi:hypothetical protein